jgi:hypothetical protein
MRTRIEKALDLARFGETTARRRALAVWLTAAAVLAFGVLRALLAPATGHDLLTDPALALLVGAGLLLAAGFMARTGRLAYGAWLVLAGWGVIGVLPALAGSTATVAAAPLLVLLLLGTLLAAERGLLVALVGAVIGAGLALIVRGGAFAGLREALLLIALTGVTAGGLALVLRAAHAALIDYTRRLAGEADAPADVLQRLTTLIGLRVTTDELAGRVAQMILDNHTALVQARVYLTGSSTHELRLAGEAARPGARPTARSSVEQALDSVRAVTVRLEDADRIEFALPLRLGSQVNGVLALQAVASSLVDPADTQRRLQTLADAAALAVEAVAHYQRAETQTAEARAQSEKLVQAQHEIERLTQRLTGGAWSQYLQTSDAHQSMSIDFVEDEIHEDTQWTPTLADAVSANSLVQAQRDDRQVIAVPLRVRGQVIGAMEFELDEIRDFAPEDYDLLNDVSERFGLAMENTRLVQESQRAAQREAHINQISARLQTTNDIERALTEAARGLVEALHASRVAIKLGEPALDAFEAGGEWSDEE